MNAFLDLTATVEQRFGELELFIEFPVDFDGEMIFLSFTGEDGVNPLECNDPAAIEFFTGAVSGNPAIAARGFPGDASEDARNAIEVFADELLGEPGYVTFDDVNMIFAHHAISETSLNPLVQCAIAVLRIVTASYGSNSRIVYWRHET